MKISPYTQAQALILRASSPKESWPGWLSARVTAPLFLYASL